MKLHDFGWCYRITEITDSNSESYTWHKSSPLPFKESVFLYFDSVVIIGFSQGMSMVANVNLNKVGCRLKHRLQNLSLDHNIDLYMRILGPDDFEILSNQHSSNSQD
jgi:hypothetical protein